MTGLKASPSNIKLYKDTNFLKLFTLDVNSLNFYVKFEFHLNNLLKMYKF